jgi:hypothetical protein
MQRRKKATHSQSTGLVKEFQVSAHVICTTIQCNASFSWKAWLQRWATIYTQGTVWWRSLKMVQPVQIRKLHIALKNNVYASGNYQVCLAKMYFCQKDFNHNMPVQTTAPVASNGLRDLSGVVTDSKDNDEDDERFRGQEKLTDERNGSKRKSKRKKKPKI